MSLPLSEPAIACLIIILAGIGVAWSRRFLAVGALAIANVAVFVVTIAFQGTQEQLVFRADLVQSEPGMAALGALTSMFAHVGLAHLLGNMIALFAFALPFEERIGPRALTVIYLAGGLAATFTQYMINLSQGQLHPLLGASGAVAAIIGAFAASYPNLIIPLPLPLGVIMIFVRMRVWIAAVCFAAVQFVSYELASAADPVAYGAHLGGLAFGLVLGGMLARSGRLGRRRPVSVDLARLAPFARDPGSVNALNHMESYQTEPQVFQAWLERFLRTATCPTCSHKVMPRHEGEMVCTQGHRFDVRAQPTKQAMAKTA